MIIALLIIVFIISLIKIRSIVANEQAYQSLLKKIINLTNTKYTFFGTAYDGIKIINIPTKDIGVFIMAKPDDWIFSNMLEILGMFYSYINVNFPLGYRFFAYKSSQNENYLVLPQTYKEYRKYLKLGKKFDKYKEKLFLMRSLNNKDSYTGFLKSIQSDTIEEHYNCAINNLNKSLEELCPKEWI